MVCVERLPAEHSGSWSVGGLPSRQTGCTASSQHYTMLHAQTWLLWKALNPAVLVCCRLFLQSHLAMLSARHLQSGYRWGSCQNPFVTLAQTAARAVEVRAAGQTVFLAFAHVALLGACCAGCTLVRSITVHMRMHPSSLLDAPGMRNPPTAQLTEQGMCVVRCVCRMPVLRWWRQRQAAAAPHSAWRTQQHAWQRALCWACRASQTCLSAPSCSQT